MLLKPRAARCANVSPEGRPTWICSVSYSQNAARRSKSYAKCAVHYSTNSFFPPESRNLSDNLRHSENSYFLMMIRGLMRSIFATSTPFRRPIFSDAYVARHCRGHVPFGPRPRFRRAQLAVDQPGPTRVE